MRTRTLTGVFPVSRVFPICRFSGAYVFEFAHQATACLARIVILQGDLARHCGGLPFHRVRWLLWVSGPASALNLRPVEGGRRTDRYAVDAQGFGAP